MPRWLDTDVPDKVLHSCYHPRLPLVLAVTATAASVLSSSGESIASVPLPAPPTNASVFAQVPANANTNVSTTDLAAAAATPAPKSRGASSNNLLAGTPGTSGAADSMLPLTACWHPSRRAFAVGLSNGTLVTWIEGKSTVTAGAHKAAVVAAAWISPPTSKDLRLATVDAEGAVLVFRCEPTKTTRVCDYRLPSGGPIVALAPFTLPPAAGTQADDKSAPAAAPQREKPAAILKSTTPCTFLVACPSQILVLSDQPATVQMHQPLFSVSTSTIARVLLPPVGLGGAGGLLGGSSGAGPRPNLLVLCENGHISLMTVVEGQRITSTQQVKIGVGAGAYNRQQVQWSAAWLAAPGLVAVSNGGQVIRLIDFFGDDSTSLELEDTEDGRINSISFDAPRNRIVAGTDSGHLVLWQCRARTSASETDLHQQEQQQRVSREWTVQPKTSVSACVDLVQFHPVYPLLLALRRQQLRLLMEHSLVVAVGAEYIAVQTGLNTIEVTPLDAGPASGSAAATSRAVSTVSVPAASSVTGLSTVITVPAALKIQGIAVGTNHLLVWGPSKAQVWHIRDKSAVAEFGHAAESMFVVGADTLVQVTLTHVLLCAMTGKSHTSIQVAATTGTPGEDLGSGGGGNEVASAAVMGDYLVVVTKSLLLSVIEVSTGRGVVNVRDLGKLAIAMGPTAPEGTPSAVTPGSTANPLPPGAELAGISAVAINPAGSHVAMIAQLGPLELLLVYSKDADALIAHPVQPIRLAWDHADPRLLAAETRDIQGDDAGAVHTFFVRGAELYVHQQQSHRGRLATVRLPYFVLVPPDGGAVQRDLLSDFVELGLGGSGGSGGSIKLAAMTSAPSRSELVPATTAADPPAPVLLDRKLVQGMMDFRFSLARGQIDEAFKLMPVKSKPIWLSLAAMCVKTRMYDATLACLGHAGHAMAVRLVREAHARGGIVEALGVAAEQLGISDDDVRAWYASNERWDLVSRVHASRGDWTAALTVVKERDRLAVPRAHFDHAVAQLRAGDVDSAIVVLAASDASPSIPLRLLAGPRPDAVANFLATATHPSHIRWHAQWAESQGNLRDALALYSKVGDTHAVVRLHCELGQVREARDAADAAPNPAASYYLAQHYERAGKIKDAVACFARARCLAHAVRLAQEHALYDDLMHLALRATPPVMLDVAAFFEAHPTPPPAPAAARTVTAAGSPRRGSRPAALAATGPTNIERAIRLYLRAGHAAKALDLAFDEQNFELLLDIVTSLATSHAAGSSKAALDAATLARCAEFLLLHQQYRKAVDLYVLSGDVSRALALCVQHKIEITEAWCDATFPADSGTPVPAATWAAVADACMQQGQYDLASKKYVAAGDKVGAIKALTKLGDVSKVVFFASVSGPKQRDIYVLAANFLQSRDWRAEPAILKHIVTFYTKAKAFDHLSSFFETCAQIEIDEYSSYEKALGALKEAAKCTTKSSTLATKEARLMLLNRKMDMVGKFTAAQAAAKTGVEDTLQLCAALLNDPDIEIGVRVGDIYALLVETYLAHGHATQARDIYTRMLGAVPLRLVPFYLDAGALAAVDPEFKDRLAASQQQQQGAPSAVIPGKRPGTAAVAEVVDDEEDLAPPSSETSELSGRGGMRMAGV
ncbi:hypothetical protein H9P43_000109 [Blastocladiella emersonii ATCC 22665]|nr:hypothetical protein H9P43_000109 [Blastocladiella emersonii ATCC 22665]